MNLRQYSGGYSQTDLIDGHDLRGLLAQQLTEQQRKASEFCIEWALAEKSLKHFMSQAWHIVEPKDALVWGWHLDAICDHLTAITDGFIRRLLINIPPRHTKSLSVAVMWPCWEWTTHPEMRFLFSSYAQELSTRDSLKCRRIIQSEWYQRRWGDNFHLAGDQNRKTRFDNNKGGYRIATSVGGVGTGEGGDRIVVDDPHNVRDGESDLKRADTLMWWDESMSTRVTDPEITAKVIVMQRVHENDLSGHVMAKEADYVHLCLPGRYEGNRVKTVLPIDSPNKFKDPRTVEGEPLSPERFTDAKLSELRKDMSEYAWAGQIQQRPAPRGGGIFKIENMSIQKRLPGPSHIVGAVRYWDKAGTDAKDNAMSAFTAGVLMFKLRNGKYFVADVVRGQWSAGKRERHIRMTAQIDECLLDASAGAKSWLKRYYQVWIEQEPGSGGKESAENTVRNLAGWVVKVDRVTGDKVSRAQGYATQIEHGNVMVLASHWTGAFIREHEKAPVGKWKDQWDAAAGAFNKLATIKLAGTW